MNIRWKREGKSPVAHAFAEIDLSAGFEVIEPVADCGRVSIDDLEEDELAERCAACVPVVEAP